MAPAKSKKLSIKSKRTSAKSNCETKSVAYLLTEGENCPSANSKVDKPMANNIRPIVEGSLSTLMFKNINSAERQTSSVISSNADMSNFFAKVG